MTTDATLAALTAGLDRDEAIARAAAELDAEGASWRVRKFRDEGMYVFGDNQSAPPGGKFGFEEDAQTEHMQSHDPARVLRQVEAHRRILARHHPIPAPPIFILGAPKPGDMVCAGCGSKGNGFGLTLWPCPDVQDLAGIYTEAEDGAAE